ncbi:MAG: hypothetical protein Kow00133_14100 [Amphiplicatus sp.]
MTGRISINLDTEGLAQAGAEVTRLAEEEIAPAAALIEEAFASASRAIERDLSRAARAGAFSLKGLARSIVNDLKGVAIDALVRKPLQSFFQSAFAGAFGGGRAGGGFVAPGASFLVGERGPELFTPSVSGRIAPGAPRRPISVSIHVAGAGDAESFRRSQTQIAAGLARALARAERNG